MFALAVLDGERQLALPILSLSSNIFIMAVPAIADCSPPVSLLAFLEGEHLAFLDSEQRSWTIVFDEMLNASPLPVGPSMEAKRSTRAGHDTLLLSYPNAIVVLISPMAVFPIRSDLPNRYVRTLRSVYPLRAHYVFAANSSRGFSANQARLSQKETMLLY
ncbi:hypothetical protein NLJ89_g4336 [Agrocybe chaxingu]|uniref:Uncharacterized protein n=1 Tax=Agrocybe chaxingu TaxID=84603 RepID=A0A9W8K2V7_9AGAR|nr:hypothetical protein NLJ89_g4336 [Agrocybe chaxingu]